MESGGEGSRSQVKSTDGGNMDEVCESEASSDRRTKRPTTFLGPLLYMVDQWRRNVFHVVTMQYDRKERVFIDSLDEHPLGYPKMAAYINSDANFAMYRRFGYLHNRVLLYKQDELHELQDNLQILDSKDEIENLAVLRSRDLDEKKSQERKDLILNIHSKLKEYDDLLFREARLRSMKPPSDRNHSSLWNWQDNTQALVKDEEYFLYYKNDFVSVGGGKENTCADEILESAVNAVGYCWPIFRKLFSSPDQRKISTQETDHYYSKARIHFVTRAIGIFLLLVVMIIPILVLFDNSSTNTVKLGVVIAGTLIFPIIVETFTRIDRHQVFATTIAYCAVLVVFLGNLQTVGCQATKPVPGST